jgi:hypothetical protein
MTHVHCRIVARYAADETASLCQGVFASPSKRAGRFLAGLLSAGSG